MRGPRGLPSAPADREHGPARVYAGRRCGPVELRYRRPWFCTRAGVSRTFPGNRPGSGIEPRRRGSHACRPARPACPLEQQAPRPRRREVDEHLLVLDAARHLQASRRPAPGAAGLGMDCIARSGSMFLPLKSQAAGARPRSVFSDDQVGIGIRAAGQKIAGLRSFSLSSWVRSCRPALRAL